MQNLMSFLIGFSIDCWSISGRFREPLWRDFEFFLIFLAAWRKLEKSHGACTRASKLNVRGGRKWHQHVKKWLRKLVQKRMRKMMPKLIEFCGKMEPKWSQKGIRKSMFFWLGFWKPLETSTERRRSVEPGRRHLIKEYRRIINKDGAGFRI